MDYEVRPFAGDPDTVAVLVDGVIIGLAGPSDYDRNIIELLVFGECDQFFYGKSLEAAMDSYGSTLRVVA